MSLGSPSPRSPLVLALPFSSPSLADDWVGTSHDLELQDTPSLSDSPRAVSGMGYRYDRTNSETSFNGTLDDTNWRAFGQLQRRASEHWQLQDGAKFEETPLIVRSLTPRVAANDLSNPRPGSWSWRFKMAHSQPRKTPGVAHLLAMLCLVISGWLSTLSANAADILLTGSEDSPGVQSFVQALRELRPGDHVRFQPLAELPSPGKLPGDLRLILLDLPSLDWRLQDPQGPATLVLRISRLQARQHLGERLPPYLSLLWSDPPLERQLRLTRTLLPQAKRVGVLYDSHSAFLLNELRRAAHPLGLEVVTQRWDNTRESRPLQALLNKCDVLLGLDDPDLYNPKTAKNLLLSSYSRQLALIGPNVGFVRAGSLASTYSDQSDWLAMLDELLSQPPATWPRTYYPPRFKVSSNPQVARSLGIEQINEASVATLLAERERRP